MGLDITAVWGLRTVRCAVPSDAFCRTHLRFYYTADAADISGSLIDGACYEPEGGETYRIGSYRYYAAWHEALGKLSVTIAQARGSDDTQQRLPFAELLGFHEVHGFFGPEPSAALARDFAEWTEEARRHFTTEQFDTYQDWGAAFAAAAGSGAVQVW